MMAVDPLITLPVDSTPIATAAEMYAQLGFAPVPLFGLVRGRCACGDPECGRASGKHPVAKDWQKRASSDVDAVREAFKGHRGNIGLMLGRALVALDVDGEAGFQSIAELDPPPTLTNRSGSGGEHRIYAYASHQDPDEVTNRRVMPGLDVKTRTGQIAVAPSLHLSGDLYRWTLTVMPVTLPDAVYDRIRKPKVAPVVSLPSRTGGGNLIERARAYLAKIDPAISGSRGHDTTFSAGRAIAGWVAKGLSKAEAWELLVEYNARCQPPWPEKDLRHKFDEALNKAHTLPALEDRPLASVTKLRPDDIRWPAANDDGSPPSGGAPPPPPPPTNDLDWRAWLLWERTAKGQRLAKHAGNATVVLRYHPAWAGRVRLNVHAQTIIVRDPPWYDPDRPANAEEEREWTDADSDRLSAWIHRELGVDINRSDCFRGAGVAADGLQFHPVRDWMQGLQWDQTPRLTAWLTTYLGVKRTRYTELVGRWWLTAAVARTFQPGCKADNVLILEGPQGLRKSSALRVLASPEWFLDTPIDLQNGRADAYLPLLGKLIVELAELDSLRRTDATRAKAFFSSPVDNYRRPYDRCYVRVPRGCVFAGSINPNGSYFQDPTGNRRFWPVLCTAIDLAALERDREQLWAEAVWAYREGARWWPETDEERAACEGEQEPRAESDEWEAQVTDYLARHVGGTVSVGDLLTGAIKLEVGKWGRSEQMRIAGIMQRLGYRRRQVRDASGGGRKWVYEHGDTGSVTDNA